MRRHRDGEHGVERAGAVGLSHLEQPVPGIAHARAARPAQPGPASMQLDSLAGPVATPRRVHREHGTSPGPWYGESERGWGRRSHVRSRRHRRWESADPRGETQAGQGLSLVGGEVRPRSEDLIQRTSMRQHDRHDGSMARQTADQHARRTAVAYGNASNGRLDAF